MKNKKIITCTLAVFAMLALGFAVGCTEKTPTAGNNDSSVIVETKKEQLFLSALSLSMEKLETATIVATFNDEFVQGVEWQSTNEAVATVSGGVITAVGTGDSVIIAKYGKAEARCSVNVQDNHLIPRIQTNIFGDTLHLIAGDAFPLSWNVTYNNQTLADTSVSVNLTAEQDVLEWKDDKILAKKEGTGTLDITLEWMGKEYTSVYTIEVVNTMTASVLNADLLTLYNNATAGVNKKLLSPVCYENGKQLSDTEYTIVGWEYDSDIISFDETTYEVTGLTKGITQLKVTFQSLATQKTVISVLPVCVELYVEDKTATKLETLFLDETEYFISVADVFKDKSNEILSGCTILSVTDVTGGGNYDIPVDENDKINIADVVELGVVGNRVWRVDCELFSYKVTVPLQERPIERALVGEYLGWSDCIVKLAIEKERNTLTNTVAFVDSDGETLDTGTFTIKPYTGNANAGQIVFAMQQDVIAQETVGFYYYADGCYQLYMSLNGEYTPVYGAIDAPYETLAGEYATLAWGVEFILSEDKTCVMFGDLISEIGTYTLTPTTPVQGTIELSFNNGFNGQKKFVGTYAYNVGQAEISVTVGETEKVLSKTGMNNEPYAQYAGFYNNTNSMPSVYLGLDGVVVLGYDTYTSGSCTAGTYVMEKGVITVTLNNSYNGKKTVIGEYYTKDGQTYITLNLGNETNVTQIYQKIGD